MKLAPVLLMLALLSGCLSFLGGEGEETLLVRNTKAEPVRAIIRIDQPSGGIPVFHQDVTVEPHGGVEYVVPMRPGVHTMRVDTTSSVNELLYVEIPKRGDTLIALTLTPDGARLSVGPR